MQRSIQQGFQRKEDKEKINILKEVTKESPIAEFSFAGLSTWAKVIDIYDGDTITIVFWYNGSLTKKKIRMMGIDTPEKSPRRKDCLSEELREMEKKAARVLRDKLYQKVGDRMAYVEFVESDNDDPFGRALAKVYGGDRCDPSHTNVEDVRQWECANDYMLACGARPYFAKKKKKPWTQSELESILSLSL